VRKPTQERSRRTLNRILDAAIACFAEDGVDGSAVSDIVKRARSSVGSFYGRFEGKDELVQAVDQRLWDQVEERWRSEALFVAGGSAGSTNASPSDSLTDINLELRSGDGRSVRGFRTLLDSVFLSLAPQSLARARCSAYLERQGLGSESGRVLGSIQNDVARRLRVSSPGTVRSGLPGFLANVVVRTAQESGTDGQAIEYLSDVLAASLQQSGAAARSRPLSAAEPPPVRTTHLLLDQEPTPAVPDSVEPAALTAPAPEPEPEAEPPTEPFDIWA